MPANRPSRRFMPRSGRRESRPNVFIQTDMPGEGGSGAGPAATPAGADGGIAGAGGMEAVTTARRRAARGRPGRSRSEVYTRTLGKELRQLGLLTAMSVTVVVVLSFIIK